MSAARPVTHPGPRQRGVWGGREEALDVNHAQMPQNGAQGGKVGSAEPTEFLEVVNHRPGANPP